MDNLIKDNRQVRRRLLRMSRKYIPYLLLTTVCRILNLLLWCALLAIPAFFVGNIATLETSKRVEMLNAPLVWFLLAVMIVLGLLKGLIRYAEQISGHFVAFHVLADLRLSLYDGVYPQAPAIIEDEGTGRLLAATADVERLEVFFAHSIAPAIAAVFVPATVLTYVAVHLGTVAFLVAFLGIFLGGVLSPLLGAGKSRGISANSANVRKEMTQHITEIVHGRMEIAQFHAEKYQLEKINTYADQLLWNQTKLGKFQGIRQAILHGWPIITAIALFVVVSWQYDTDIILILPWILSAMAAILGISNALFGITTLASALPSAITAARRLFTLIDRRPLVNDPIHPQSVPEGELSIEISDVCFAYDEQSEALRDISITVHPGQIVAIVGATGSGKSTIASLAARVRDPQQGSIKLSNSQGWSADVKDISLSDLRKAIGYSTQKNLLLRGTIAQNLRLADPESTDSQLLEVLDRVGFSLESFPAGLDTIIDQNALVSTANQKPEKEQQGIDVQNQNEADTKIQKSKKQYGSDINCTVQATNGDLSSTPKSDKNIGRQLSGGEAQRLCLARTILPKPRVLILDEATSHQDPLTQTRILLAIKNNWQSVIVIAHRLVAIKDADVIYVLENGQVVESGSWEEILHNQGAFARIVESNEEEEYIAKKDSSL